MNDIRQQLAPGFSAVNIALMVVLYMASWPLALVMLAYVVWGQKVGLDLGRPQTLKAFWNRLSLAFKAGLETFKKHP